MSPRPGLLLVCALASAGCRPRPPAFASPPPLEQPLVQAPPEQPPPDEPLPDAPPPGDPTPGNCVVRFTFPATAEVGRYPSFDIEAQPPIAYHGKGPEPTAIMSLTAPDGAREERRIPLVYPPACEFCLPEPGSSGCEHSCHWQPFSRSVGSVQLKTTGRHRVEVRLESSSCRLEGGRAVITGVR